MRLVFASILLACSITTYASDDVSMDVKVGTPSVTVTLPANPTTGFQWSVVQFDKKVLSLSRSNFERPKTNLIGAGGQMNFTFLVLKTKNYPKSTKIELKYARSWEPKSAVTKQVTINFVK